MSPRPFGPALVVALSLLVPTGALADTYRVLASDGTVHYTNVPTDPTYQRVGFATRPPVEPPRSAGAGDIREGFLRYVRQASLRHGVPEKLVTAVIRTESDFNPRAVSPKGARGLMQLMPQTAALLGVRDSFDPAENIEGGVRHLRQLIDRFDNNLSLALAAYNAGEQAVTQHRGIPPYPETQGYVQKVLALFNGGATAWAARGARAAEYPTQRYVGSDGTVVYSNLPPATAARLLR